MKKISSFLAMTVVSLLFALSGSAQKNPIIKNHFTPDPAPYVHGNKVYLFTDHDEDKPNDYFHMKEL